MRAQRIIFSSKGDGIDDLATMFEVSRQTVSIRIDPWEQHGVASVYDHARSGAPRTFTAAERDVVTHLLTDHPHSPKMIFAKIVEQRKNTISLSTLQRIVKNTASGGNVSEHRSAINAMKTSLTTQPRTSKRSNTNTKEDGLRSLILMNQAFLCNLRDPLPINRSEKP